MQKNSQSENNNKKMSKDAVTLLIILIISTVVVFSTYRILLNYYYFEYVLIAYLVIETVFIFAYVIYNRGFSRRGITPDMLPDTMSLEEKEEFIQSGKDRLKKSRWMLLIILAFLFTFTVDIFELWIIPTVKGWLK